MSQGTAKEVKVKLRPSEGIDKTDFSSVGGTSYTYEIAYTDHVHKVVVEGTTFTEVTVSAADPDLGDEEWGQYDNVLYIGASGWGGFTRKIVVTYELYFVTQQLAKSSGHT